MISSHKVNLGLSFMTALIVANVSGPQYIFPTFGTSLEERFNWSALENSIVSTACFIGVSFSGPLCSWMIERFGIKRTLRISALLAFTGLTLLAQAYAGRFPGTFLCCALYLICLGVAGAASYLCALDSQSHNFKHNRGFAMGFTTAAIGLCGVVFSQINDFLFGDEEYENAPVENDSTYNFLMFLAIVMSVGLFIGSFFLGPVLEPKKVDEEQDENTPLLAKGTGSEVEGISGLDFLLHPIGFALFSTLFLVLGIGYVYLANIGQILLALSPEATQHVRNFHITVFSLGNCGSRAFFGALSDLLRNKFGIHRLWIFLFAVIGMIVTLVYFLAAVNDANDLLPCTLAVSMSYGIVFGIAPAATTEFGTEVFARNWGWLLFAPAFGSQLFNILFGVMYGREAENQGSHVCQGAVCFTSTFRVGVVGGFISLVIVLFAIYRTGIYRRYISVDRIN